MLKVFLSLLFLFPIALFGQSVELRGLVKDQSGEALPFANVLILPDSTLIPAEIDGHFSSKLTPGPKSILISYTGYKALQSNINLKKDTSITFSLSAHIGQLKEVSITARRYAQENIIQTSRMSTITLTKRDITAIPLLGGEADVIKALQLLPGRARGIEGSSDTFVRGGAADQNLVLLDGAPVYNPSHLFGFLSVFNPDILEKVEAIHGGFPAEYGGKLSSILNITTKKNIAEKTRASGDIGLITSRLFVEQPLIKDKLSIWVAGRRSYIDRFFKLIDKELPYYFYDLNGKISFRPGKNDHLEISYFGGKDHFKLSRKEDQDHQALSSNYTSTNTSQSVRWHHRYGKGWKSNITLFRTFFQYNSQNTYAGNELFAFSDIGDLGAKVIFEKDSLGKASGPKAGFEWTKHSISPNVVNSTGRFAELLESTATQGKVFHEGAVFIRQEWPVTDRLLAGTGFRGSFALLNNKRYFVPEPRLALRYSLNEDESVKLSYSRMAQYMHRISSAAISSPTDIWYPVTDSIPPQSAQQLSAAWQKFVRPEGLFFSIEAYYKIMNQQLGFEEGTNLFFHSDFQSKIVKGRGRAYGTEFLMRKETGRLTGWLSYTLSWSNRQFNQVNKGAWFPSRYDRRHNGSVVVQYALGKRWAASMVWEYISGSRFTPIIGQHFTPAPSLTGLDFIPIYSGINQVKLADTHRLDLAIKYSSKRSGRFGWHLFAGVNNVYNRASPIAIFVDQDTSDGSLKYTQPGLFGLLPFISCGFKL